MQKCNSELFQRMSKRKCNLPPPNQPSIKMFISGVTVGWKPGDSPLISGAKGEERQPSDGNEFEKEVHSKILEAGIFNNFANQPAALAYLNGQFMVRKEHSKKLEDMKKSVENFQKSGVTRRFMKVPSKLLDKDKYNSERELARAEKVLAEMKRFKADLVVLKRNCLDDAQSVKPKKLEEIGYYSDRIKEIIEIIENMQKLRNRLFETNLEINRSSGVFGSSRSIHENRRIMRRKKESAKVEARKKFQRCVNSLKGFMSKYSKISFEEIFDIEERKIPVAANHHGTKHRGKPVAVSQDFSFHLEDEFEPVGDADESDIVDEEVDFDMVEERERENSINNNENPGGTSTENGNQKKYQHCRIEKSIKLKRQLLESDFISLSFIKNDFKSLSLLRDMNAGGGSFGQVVRSTLSEWELDQSSKLIECDEEISEEECEELNSEEENVLNEGEEIKQMDVDAQGQVKDKEQPQMKESLRKKYKKYINKVLSDHGKKMKKKKLRKKIVEVSSEFDERDEEVRAEMFEKYLLKMRDIVIEGKYVSSET